MNDWVLFGDEESARVDPMFGGADNVEIRVCLSASATEAELDAVCAFAGEIRGRLFDPITRALP